MSRQRIAYVHFDTDNTGDRMSTPWQFYGDSLGDTAGGKPYHIRGIQPSTCDAVIYGGGALGGLLMRGEHMRVKTRKRIAWGIGRSVHGETNVASVPMPEGFDLLGVREWSTPQRGTYVPCASCMSPLFNRAYPITREAVLFVNASSNIGAKYPTRVEEDLPVMNNRRSMHEIIPFLASAETVVTNSYHGAYWGALLGRKVVVASAYSSKFHGFKFPPVFVYDGNWRREAKRVMTYAGALADARMYTEAFHKEVVDFLAEK